DLWMQNDLCIMFADTNVGKSILAVQLADSISRGLPIPGFGLTAEPAPVLYFDFELSDYQFRARYSSAETGKYPFTAGFHRATLNDYSPKQRRFKTFEQFISNEIENALLACKAKTLIIDNISCLRYGTHNTAGALNLMQYLQGIKRTYKISILVLAHTPKRNPTKPITRNDLQGSKMLINLADSAFAIGESRQQPGLKYLKQIKQRGAPETHGADNVCLGLIARTGSFMHFTFAGHSHESDHLAPQTEQYRRSTEQRIAELHSQNHSVRKIAAQLGLAPTTIFRALKKLEQCGKEGEEGCADMQMCQCADEEKYADEEMPIAESVDDNQYLAIQLQAPAACDYELIVCSSKAFMSSFVGSLPTGGCREGFSKPVPPYEAQSHDNQNAPQCCHTEALEVRPKPLTSYEAKSHDDQKATNHPKATSMPQPSNPPTSIIEIIIPPQKQRNPQNNPAPKIPGYKPEGGFLTIDDEIEGLTYLQKCAPLIFTGEYKSRLQLLKKIKDGLFDG
ncbi:MAG: AAA family ATPase, partial [Bacteroidota bacterium]